MLKPGITSKEISIYEFYLQRMQKESDLIWSRFKIYFGFNSGLLSVIGFLFSFNAPILQGIQQYTDLIFYTLLIIDIFFSFAWLFINIDGIHWQNTFNGILINLEKKIFINPSDGMYNKINESKKLYDVLYINIILSCLFIGLWIGALIIIQNIL
jgi:hypothetical protein